MRNRLEIFALCAVLLLLPVFLEANAQAMEGSTPVFGKIEIEQKGAKM